MTAKEMKRILGHIENIMCVNLDEVSIEIQGETIKGYSVQTDFSSIDESETPITRIILSEEI